MKKILIALTLFASVTVASAQTKKPAQKAAAKKECCEVKKECCVKEEVAGCCSPGSKAKAIVSAKKVPAKKG
ncbi:hypothetical protein ACFSJU_03430 [Paradesertivirga mongoliensis]|uniref:Uncharacterized protein n=1 Tax=Paradesertivirga mongoliensis TaxID=2100740 RepID=A0ABW4ZIH5_9SPHI|nr:hypothetical protein [Pedobacter mongoliensis]